MNKNRNLDYIDPNSSPATGTLRCVDLWVGRKYGAAEGGSLYQGRLPEIYTVTKIKHELFFLV